MTASEWRRRQRAVDRAWQAYRAGARWRVVLAACVVANGVVLALDPSWLAAVSLVLCAWALAVQP